MGLKPDQNLSQQTLNSVVPGLASTAHLNENSGGFGQSGPDEFALCVPFDLSDCLYLPAVFFCRCSMFLASPTVA